MTRFIYIEVRDVRGEGEDTSVLSFDSMEVSGVSTEKQAYEEGPLQLEARRDKVDGATNEEELGYFMNDFVVVLA